MTIGYEAMVFAREVHKDQKRKYTGNPYADHLAEVAGIAVIAAALATVMRLERCASGHEEYHATFALYCAELELGELA